MKRGGLGRCRHCGGKKGTFRWQRVEHLPHDVRVPLVKRKPVLMVFVSLYGWCTRCGREER